MRTQGRTRYRPLNEQLLRSADRKRCKTLPEVVQRARTVSGQEFPRHHPSDALGGLPDVQKGRVVVPRPRMPQNRFVRPRKLQFKVRDRVGSAGIWSMIVSSA